MSSSTKSKATSMADLMKSVKTKFVSPQKGQILEGTITKLTSSEILVDIGAKTECVVLEKDKKILKSLLSSLKVGDKVTVSVLNPESDFGNAVVSLRRFNDEKVWKKLEELYKSKEQFDITIDDLTRGGFLVSTQDGVSGFLPNSQVSFLENSQSLLGKTIKASVIELNRALKKIIFSQKAGMGSEDFDKAVKTLKIGQKIKTTISNVAPFGIFTYVKFDSTVVEGFIHISEVSWEKTITIPDIYKAGEEIEAEIINFDFDAKRINLSIKKLTQNPFEEKLKSFAKDQKVTGTVFKVLSSGILVSLGEGIEGFIKKDKIPPTQSFKEGSSINATVVELDQRKQRVNLVPVLTEKPIGYR
ncbi:MAG TPA: S1 RNA-binding domain-containing protein [Candidatus Sulfotelmatobacter sp.]|nr:S1 RNA-binding domain-containing protein [Candidatus Sulfotelmatobacter sp.]